MRTSMKLLVIAGAGYVESVIVSALLEARYPPLIADSLSQGYCIS